LGKTLRDAAANGYVAQGPSRISNATIGALSLKSERVAKPLLREHFVASNPQVSADGRWMAYFSAESGQFEVYVRPLPDVNSERWRISTESRLVQTGAPAWWS
jgi:hypothetical protein